MCDPSVTQTVRSLSVRPQRKSLTPEPDMSFTTEERGRLNTAEHRVFFSKSTSFASTASAGSLTCNDHCEGVTSLLNSWLCWKGGLLPFHRRLCRQTHLPVSWHPHLCQWRGGEPIPTVSVCWCVYFMFHILCSPSDGQILSCAPCVQRSVRVSEKPPTQFFFYCFQSLQRISLFFLSSAILLSADILE